LGVVQGERNLKLDDVYAERRGYTETGKGFGGRVIADSRQKEG